MPLSKGMCAKLYSLHENEPTIKCNSHKVPSIHPTQPTCCFPPGVSLLKHPPFFTNTSEFLNLTSWHSEHLHTIHIIYKAYVLKWHLRPNHSNNLSATLIPTLHELSTRKHCKSVLAQSTAAPSFLTSTGNASGGCFTNVLRALQKFSRNLCIVQIVHVMRISSWNFVRVPKALFWAHVQIFTINVISGVVYFRENILGSSRNISETAPSCIPKKLHDGNDENPLARMIGVIPGLLPACALNHCEKLLK